MNYTGLAKIIPFTPRAQVRVGPPWTTAELGELFRVAHVLRQSGMMIETDMGLSDEGDPWFVFYSVQSEDVIAHFARINGEIVVHGLSASGVVSGVDLHEVVRRLQPVQAMEHQQKSQNDRSVVLHPFMLLVAFVAASFLATEESQAAAPADRSAPGAGTPAETAAVAAKMKTDWIDRAMTLLHSKAKDRIDGAAQEATHARKLAAGDTLQHSMALVMLAAAISQAQADIFFSDDAFDQDLGSGIKASPEFHKLTVTDVVAAVDAAGVDALASIGGQTNGSAQPLESQTASDGGGVFPSVSGTGSNGSFDPVVVIPVAAPAVAVLPAAASAETAPGTAVPLLSAVDHIFLPETVPVVVVAHPVLGSGMTKAAPATVSTAPATSSAVTSFDITFEGGMLQFHQNSVDIRLIEVVASQQESLKVSETPVKETPVTVEPGKGAVPAIKTIVLTSAQENILVENGETRIKNFDFGVDHLVIQDPLLLLKQPDVQFSFAGDIIITFGDSARVVLLGIFEPSQMLSGVASVSAV